MKNLNEKMPLANMSPLRIIDQAISGTELTTLANERFGDMVKAVVDIRRGLMAIGGELHADGERFLLDNGSRQADVWGINIYPDKTGLDRVEFDSMINIRPSQGNRTRGITDANTRRLILDVVHRLTPAR